MGRVDGGVVFYFVLQLIDKRCSNFWETIRIQPSNANLPPTMFCACLSCNLNIDSQTAISVAVVSKPGQSSETGHENLPIPQKQDQSFTTNPAPRTSEPLFTVPATRGI